MSQPELPTSAGHVGSLLTALLCLEIPGGVRASIKEHDGVRYILAPHGCGHPHSGQTGVLWLGSPRSQPRKTQPRSREHLPQVIRAEQELTKYPYSLLFSFLRLVREPHGPSTLDDWVPVERALEWCSRYGLPATESQVYIDGLDCLRLDTFQRETVILYWLFQLWKALSDWKLFEESSGPIDPDQADKHRKTIHRYAAELLRLYRSQHRSVVASDMALGSAIRTECKRKQALDRRPDPDVKTCYRTDQVRVDDWAKMFVNDVISQHMHQGLVLGQESCGLLLRARSTFAACYLQLAGLREQPPGEWARHLRLCDAPSCGRIFWGKHANNRYCERHPRQAVEMAKKRATRRTPHVRNRGDAPDRAYP